MKKQIPTEKQKKLGIENRIFMLSCAVSFIEKQKIKELADKYKMSVSEYLRTCAFNKPFDTHSLEELKG